MPKFSLFARPHAISAVIQGSYPNAISALIQKKRNNCESNVEHGATTSRQHTQSKFTSASHSQRIHTLRLWHWNGGCRGCCQNVRIHNHEQLSERRLVLPRICRNENSEVDRGECVEERQMTNRATTVAHHWVAIQTPEQPACSTGRGWKGN
jgi:hypothetical protein